MQSDEIDGEPRQGKATQHAEEDCMLRWIADKNSTAYETGDLAREDGVANVARLTRICGMLSSAEVEEKRAALKRRELRQLGKLRMAEVKHAESC